MLKSYRKSWAANLFHVVRFDLGPLLLIIGPRGLQCENDL